MSSPAQIPDPGPGWAVQTSHALCQEEGGRGGEGAQCGDQTSDSVSMSHECKCFQVTTTGLMVTKDSLVVDDGLSKDSLDSSSAMIELRKL